MMRDSDLTLLVLVASAATGCISASRCPTDRLCGNATWYTGASASPPLEGRLVLAPLTAVAGAGGDGAEALAVGSRPVYLRFDLRGIGAGATIERAVLTLAPHVAWQPRGVSTVLARGLVSSWQSTSAAGGGAIVDPDPAGSVVIPGQMRTPVRIDVTSALRSAGEGSTTFEGVALTALGAPVVFTGLGSDGVAMRPRLEVVVR